MLKLLSKLFREKPPAIDAGHEAGMERMAKKRRKTAEMAAMAAALSDESEPEDGQTDSRKDILSKARDMEIGTSWKGYSSRGKEEYERRMGSLIRDWHERVNHLPGFETDPQV